MILKSKFLLALISIIVLGASGCTSSPPSNANRQGAVESAPKPGRWVSQYRSPASLSYAGVNLSYFFYSGISVVSRDVVFVCGDIPKDQTGEESLAVLVRTTDGGQKWIETPVVVPGMQIPTLNAIHFISPELGWAVGADSAQRGVVLKTTDGGSSWTGIRLPHKQIPTTVFFTDAETGWIGGATPPRGEEDGVGGASAILATTDGGLTWQTQHNVPISIYRVSFVDKVNGWASGSKGFIYRTTDAGRTWDSTRTEIETLEGPVDPHGDGAKQFAIRGVHFTDKDNGFAAAGATEQEAMGYVLATSNGGATWRRAWMIKGGGVRDVVFINSKEGWAVSDDTHYIYHTVDGGQTWLSEPRVFEQELQLARVGAADADRAWAVGGGGIFHRTSQ